MRARDVMTRDVVWVRGDHLVSDAAALLTEHGFAVLPVVDEVERVLGVISLSDARRAVGDPTAPVWSVMSSPAVVASTEADLSEVVRLLLDHQVRSVPVTACGTARVLVGMLSRGDLLRLTVRPDEVLVAAIQRRLDDYAGRGWWRVEVEGGAVTVTGEFTDEAERRVVTALVHTVPGVRLAEVVHRTPAPRCAGGRG
ncbi:BON domain-containing protein [Streptoalloteichus tenebrarius]|uniref:BON domain-containing protein n=1 Tax=Streptoalloteichus tenebrarius (strain ATCC 17920 / DSM 40477 / JCM 4838 / CBS 697.72 / NBRC 16177 / NCIMB 11028 / NRRL B-12390 / A12253. 1 / ISP 5477) TaxID=1933 RepID=A0ABT1HUD5_STRSD|nr:CBS domain-containing protein [Streptoalloteichus tenebrarius]MCP2259102.1 BON domain-containing protein [Streptoalloteichus tenebrarius]BFE99572.1 CBS domain-containing protein [Streptoalloteichus tenebrarius]